VITASLSSLKLEMKQPEKLTYKTLPFQDPMITIRRKIEISGASNVLPLPRTHGQEFGHVG
jgi:hypothetical protein